DGCHVGRNRIRPGITIVARIITGEMPEKGDKGCVWIDRQEVFWKDWIRYRDAIVGLTFRMDVVQGKIDIRKAELTTIKNTNRSQFRLLHFRDQLGRNLLRWVSIIGRKSVEDLFVPDPVLQHLRRCFNEVRRYAGAGEANVFGIGHNGVQSVAELMKERFHVLMAQE